MKLKLIVYKKHDLIFFRALNTFSGQGTQSPNGLIQSEFPLKYTSESVQCCGKKWALNQLLKFDWRKTFWLSHFWETSEILNIFQTKWRKKSTSQCLLSRQMKKKVIQIMHMYNFDDTETFCFKKWGHLILIMSKHNILILSLLKYETCLQIQHINMNTCQNGAIEILSKWNYLMLSCQKKGGNKPLLRFPIKNSNKTLDS